MNTNKQIILVVDDEIHILHVVSLKLRNAGYDVITAQNGLDALELTQVEQPDLVITDYQMPGLSGLELCQRMKQIPSTREIPTVLLTARGYTLDPDATARAGIALCLNKPFSPREILTKIQKVLLPQVSPLVRV